MNNIFSILLDRAKDVNLIKNLKKNCSREITATAIKILEALLDYFLYFGRDNRFILEFT